jgi:membrane-bound serine protease (ClpP class)
MRRLLISLIGLLPVLLPAAIQRLRVEGPIESIVEEYVVNSLAAVPADAELVILELDTPGGFDTSMRAIIKEMLKSRVPVAVFVSPRGARAASAGFFMMMAADIAAMIPGTNCGAAHPVNANGSDIESTMNEKVTNDAVSFIKSLAKSHRRNLELAANAVSESHSYTAEECLKNNLIEFLAGDINDLVRQLDGRSVVLGDGRSVTLKLSGKKIVTVEMSGRQRFLRTITNPSLAYFLLLIGLIGLYIEFTHPGVLIPGILGAICLLLAFLAFQILPINYVGLFLILLAVGLFIAEIKVQGFGMLGVGGMISFFLGSLILINSPIPEMRPRLAVIVAVTVTFSGILLFLTYKAVEALGRRVETGAEGMIGETGVTRTMVGPTGGRVFVHGEWWNAVATEEIPAGQEVKVMSVTDLLLTVKPLGG